jgi:hypothetical protein
MPLLTEPTSLDLSAVSENDLIIELHNRDVSLETIKGSYYALGEMEGHRLDELLGYSEDGLHGRNSDKPQPVTHNG